MLIIKQLRYDDMFEKFLMLNSLFVYVGNFPAIYIDFVNNGFSHLFNIYINHLHVADFAYLPFFDSQEYWPL